MKKKINGIVWGIVLIALGVILALDAFGISTMHLFLDGWWTLLIILPCAVGLFTEKSKLGNLVGLAGGIFLFLWQRDILSFDLAWKLFLPTAIVLAGLNLLFKSLLRKKDEPTFQKLKSEGKETKTACAAFSGCELNYSGEPFDGAELVAIFGGVECDLRKADLTEDCVIRVTAVFGGVDILVPENVKVKANTVSIFGGLSDKNDAKDGTVTLYVEGVCIFGGVDIK